MPVLDEVDGPEAGAGVLDAATTPPPSLEWEACHG